MKLLQKFKRYGACMLIAAMVLSNQMVVSAAHVVLSSVSEIFLADNSVSENVYLLDVMTLNKGDSFVGRFYDPNDYKYYYGSSKDLHNWDLKAPYFSLTYGNGICAGLSGSSYGGTKEFNYTKDGITWKTIDFDDSFEPNTLKFENGLFKLYAHDSERNLYLFVSEDAETWIDITEDLSEHHGVARTFVKDGKIYKLANEADKFSVLTSDFPNANTTVMKWTGIDALKMDGYSLFDFYFDGSKLGVQLYSIASYSSNGYSNEYVYFVTSDFVNWSEKDWTKTEYSYSVYDSTSTESLNKSIGDYAEIRLQPEMPNPGEIQLIMFSLYQGATQIEDIKITLNGKIINTVDQNNTEYIIEDGVLFDKEKTRLISYSGDHTEYTVPTSVTTIGNSAFDGCRSIQNITIPDSVTTIGHHAFSGCTGLTSVVIPDTVTSIGSGAFAYCDNLKNVVLPNGITSLNGQFFLSCDNLERIVIPSSVTQIASWEFPYHTFIVYGTPGSYAETFAKDNGHLFADVAKFSNTVDEGPYIYSISDPGESFNISGKLHYVEDKEGAVRAITYASWSMYGDMRSSATAIDRMTVLAEGAISAAASVEASGTDIKVTDAIVKELEPKANEVAVALEETLSQNNIDTQRAMNKTVKVKVTSNDNVITIDKAAADTTIDNVKVETGFASVTIPAAEKTQFKLEKKGTNSAAVYFDKGKETTVKLSFPNITGDTKYMAIIDENGKAIGGKYNPATGELEAKISQSGVYTVVNNEKNFDDISHKSVETQLAIKTLAAKGIINGTSETTFSPDASISRAEIAALIVRTLSKVDPNADGGFKDVTPNDWYFAVAGSSRKYGIINGYEDNTFRGNNVILKDQIMAVAARVLKNEMKYEMPANSADYLTYSDADALPDWAKGDIALAQMTNMVIPRVDGQFVPSDEMTRGDAAIVLIRLFNKIW